MHVSFVLDLTQILGFSSLMIVNVNIQIQYYIALLGFSQRDDMIPINQVHPTVLVYAKESTTNVRLDMCIASCMGSSLFISLSLRMPR